MTALEIFMKALKPENWGKAFQGRGWRPHRVIQFAMGLHIGLQIQDPDGHWRPTPLNILMVEGDDWHFIEETRDFTKQELKDALAGYACVGVNRPNTFAAGWGDHQKQVLQRIEMLFKDK